MALIGSSSPAYGSSRSGSSGLSRLRETQALAKQKALEKRARKHKVPLGQLAMFTQQLASMLEAGLPLVTALEALQEQVSDQVFAVIIRNVRLDIAAGASFSEALNKYPKAFPNLLVSMVEAGEASGGLGPILQRVADYFEDTVALGKKVRSALTYPVAVIVLAIVLVIVMLIFVIPEFSNMFADFGADLPAPTQALIAASEFMRSQWYIVFGAALVLWFGLKAAFNTPNGRVVKDRLILRLPVFGKLIQKINLARFCRTYSTLIRSGVPILRSLEITSRASNNAFIQQACDDISRAVTQGGQLTDALMPNPYFPPVVKHMARAGEQTGNVDGMMEKIAEFYDVEVKTTVDALTSLMEPLLITFLGVVVGGIVMSMFLPIFQLATVVGGPGG